jgi:hypothetical protein
MKRTNWRAIAIAIGILLLVFLAGLAHGRKPLCDQRIDSCAVGCP